MIQNKNAAEGEDEDGEDVDVEECDYRDGHLC